MEQRLEKTPLNLQLHRAIPPIGKDVRKSHPGFPTHLRSRGAQRGQEELTASSEEPQATAAQPKLL